MVAAVSVSSPPSSCFPFSSSSFFPICFGLVFETVFLWVALERCAHQQRTCNLTWRTESSGYLTARDSRWPLRGLLAHVCVHGREGMTLCGSILTHRALLRGEEDGVEVSPRTQVLCFLYCLPSAENSTHHAIFSPGPPWSISGLLVQLQSQVRC